MTEWWSNLTLISQIYYCIAIAATVILLIQSILLFFGIGVDSDADGGGGDSDGNFDTDGGLSLFTIRGIVAFFTMGGWTGVLLSSVGTADWITIVVSLIVGAAALFVIALIMKAFTKLQSNGSMDLANAIGKTATVYLKIPPKGEGKGKITLTFGGRFVEIDAISDSEKGFPMQAIVKVVGVSGDDLIVSEMEEE